MENTLVKLPDEVKLLAEKVSEEKKQEVQSVLSQVFAGTSDWKKQVDAIEVKDINDTMSIQLADTARKNAKQARINAEKIFDAKRSEVQAKMQDYKTEDALWLKAKQTMQILFKDIEDTAKFKSEYRERYYAEQKELRTQQRLTKIAKFNPEITRDQIENLTDETFNIFLSGLEKDYNDKIEAERKAEEERIAREKAEAEERERVRKENERLRKEAEEKEKQLAKERAEAERKRKEIEEKARKEREAAETKLRKEREAKAKLEAQIKVQKEAEEKARKEEEARILAEKKAKEEEEERKAKLAPDKDKLLLFAGKIKNIEFPQVESMAAEALLQQTRSALNRISEQIITNANNL